MTIQLKQSRRNFLTYAGGLTVLAGTPFLANLASMSAHAQSAPGYKALVCVFLFGGNDQSNTLVPRTGADYAAYRAGRPTLALDAASLLPLSPLGYNGTELGLHPSLGGIQQLFASGKCAVMANVGTLTQTLTKAQWNNGEPSVNVPAQLFSHSDQQGAWQTGVPDRASQTGWLGRMGDALTSAMQPGSPLSVCISTGGNNVMQVGDSVVQYQISTQGAVKVNQLSNLFGENAVGGQALREILTGNASVHAFEQQYASVAKRAIDAEALVSAAIAPVALRTAFGSDSVAAQLKMVARMIGARSNFSHRRQIFFVQSGGWDFHDNLNVDQALRLKALGDALQSFYNATVELGVANEVTTFTASEFGRALQSNGRGSDHGWGGHQFVIGGAVRGQRVFGSFPRVALGGPEDSGQGRLIPTTPVDALAANLGRWMGVSEPDLAVALPNLGRFRGPDLGLLNPG